MEAKLEWIQVEESGAFGDGERFYVGLTKEFDHLYPWFHTSLAELQSFHQQLGQLIEAAVAPYASVK